MPQLILPFAAPGFPLRINPLYADQCAVLFSGSIANGQMNLANLALPLTRHGTILAPDASPRGMAVHFDANNELAIYLNVTTNVATFTLLLDFYVTNLAGLALGLFQYASTTGSSGTPRLLVQNNNGDLRIFWAGDYRITESGTLPVSTQHAIVVRFDGTTLHGYRNGKKLGTYTGAGSETGSRVWFGNGYANSAGANHTSGAWWERDLGDDAARTLSLDPTQVFDPEPIILHWTTAAGAIIGPLIGGSHLLTNGPLVRGRLSA